MIFYFVREFFQRISSDILDFFTDTLFPRLKTALLYPFAKAGNVSAQLDIVQIHLDNFFYENRKIPEEWLKKGIWQKNPRAYVLMGRFIQRNIELANFESHLGRKKQIAVFTKALNFYKKAAAQNYAIGQYWVYQIHYYKEYCGWKTDGTKELALAAENDCPNAQFHYAEKFLKSANVEEGFYWMKKAASQPEREWKKCESNSFYDEAKKWVKNNKNIIQIRKLAMEGNADAMYKYAQYIEHYSFMNDSLKLGHEWITKAAKKGSVPAMCDEASFIVHGWVDGTLEEAVEYYKKAIAGGSKIAHWGLGECYLYGWGTEKNYEKAKYHLRKAAKYGYRFCAKQLKGVTLENIVKIDGEKVLEGHRDFYN